MNVARRMPGRRWSWIIAALGIGVAAIAALGEHRWRAGTAAGEADLRALRTELQRVERARIRLERDGERAASLALPPDEVRIAILEAVGELARSPRVALLGHALRSIVADPHGSGGADASAGHPTDGTAGPPVLRLTVDLEAVHAVRLLEAIARLRAALPGHPMEVAGCRIDRSDVSGAEAGTLVASCALDWRGWPT